MNKIGVHVKLSVCLFLIFLSTSCKSDKGELRFRLGENRARPFKVEIKPTYESLKEVLIKRSCLKCHNPDSDPEAQAPDIPLDTYDDLVELAEDVAYTLAADCDDNGYVCMPERGDSGELKAPAPSAEVIQAFLDWVAADYPKQ